MSGLEGRELMIFFPKVTFHIFSLPYVLLYFLVTIPILLSDLVDSLSDLSFLLVDSSRIIGGF